MTNGRRRLKRRIAASVNPSRSNTLEFCIGSLAEMTEGDIYDVVDTYSRQQRLGYVHFRNVTGKAPHYKETFIDDGDVGPLIELSTGFHVIRLVKREYAGRKPFDVPVQILIREKLRQEIAAREMKKMINELKKTALIEYSRVAD